MGRIRNGKRGVRRAGALVASRPGESVLRERSCEMSSTKKKFDAVEMMRSIRDKLSAQIEGMTLEEELEWLASQELEDPFLERLRKKAAQQGDAADAVPPRR